MYDILKITFAVVVGVISSGTGLIVIARFLISPNKEQIKKLKEHQKEITDPIKEQVNNHIPTQIRELKESLRELKEDQRG